MRCSTSAQAGGGPAYGRVPAASARDVIFAAASSHGGSQVAQKPDLFAGAISNQIASPAHAISAVVRFALSLLNEQGTQRKVSSGFDLRSHRDEIESHHLEKKLSE